MPTMLEAGNFGNYFIRHRNYRGRIDADDGSFQFLQDASFELRPGLADNAHVSFESVNYPGYFLRHRGFEIWLDVVEDTDVFRQDATFRRHAGLANNAFASFEALNYGNHFIRHQNFELFLQQHDGTDQFNQDATFEVQAAPTAPRAKGPIEAYEDDLVGNDKRIRTKAILYTNGLLSIEAWSRSSHITEALRGWVVVICRDGAGRAIWVSEARKLTVRCARLDPTCAAVGTDHFLEQFDEVIGRNTVALDIINSEQGLGNFRNVVIQGLRTAQDIAAEVKALIDEVYG